MKTDAPNDHTGCPLLLSTYARHRSRGDINQRMFLCPASNDHWHVLPQEVARSYGVIA